MPTSFSGLCSTVEGLSLICVDMRYCTRLLSVNCEHVERRDGATDTAGERCPLLDARALVPEYRTAASSLLFAGAGCSPVASIHTLPRLD